MNCPLRSYLLIFLLLFSFQIFGQEICGFDVVHNRKLQSDPIYRKRMESYEAGLQESIRKIKNNPPFRTGGALYTIPVVVHIIHTGGAIGTIYNPTDAQIQSTIDYLNQVYNGSYAGTEGVGDLQIQFVLAKRDPNCNGSTGIDRTDGSGLSGYVADGVNVSGTSGADELSVKNLVRWDPFRYYNIWVVDKIDGMDGTTGTFVAGFAAFPGGLPADDGVIMLATQMGTGKKTLPHEIGHAFSLYHPFEGSSGSTCPANTDCTTDGDKICDTDPITQPAAFACRTGSNPCTGTNYDINTEHNYMNYTSCSTLFTAEQKIRMLASAGSPLRIGLSTSRGGNANYPMTPYTPPVAATCTPVTSATGLSNNYAGILNVSLAGQNNNSSTAKMDNGYLDGTGCINLLQIQKGNTYTLQVILLGANNEQLRVWIDYNNDGALSNSTEQIFYASDIPMPASGFDTVTTSFTIPASATENTVLRLRLSEEVSTVYGAGFKITSACYNPTYGQTEDYPLLISASSLPVILEYFKGIPEGQGTRLDWKSIFELDLKEYHIERSDDGKNFVSIATVSAVNRSQGSVYSYFDPQYFLGTRYFRLKMLDIDGQFRYSNVAVVKNDQNLQGKLFVVNPFHNSLDISLGRMPRKTFELSLYDVTGNKLIQQNTMPSQSQIHIDLATQHLSSGIYVLDLVIDGEHNIQKIVKQ